MTGAIVIAGRVAHNLQNGHMANQSIKVEKYNRGVIPAKAGIHYGLGICTRTMDSRLRGNDKI
jgi:hypothetical protein